MIIMDRVHAFKNLHHIVRILTGIYWLGTHPLPSCQSLNGCALQKLNSWAARFTHHETHDNVTEATHHGKYYTPHQEQLAP